MPDTKIIIGSQAIRIQSNCNRLKDILHYLFNHLTYYEMVANPKTKSYHKEAKMKFYIFKEKDNYFDFIISINSQNNLLYFLKEYRYDMSTIKWYKKSYPEDRIKIPLRKEFKPRPNQRYYIDKIVKSDDVLNMLIDLQTGFGKTLIGYFSSVELGVRPAVLVKPTFLPKWVEDIKKYSPLLDDEIYIIKGSNSLNKLFSYSKKKRDKIKIYVISTRTINNYFEAYYSDEFTFKVTPYEFTDFCGISTVLNDESHKEFETTFKTLTWLDPKRIVGMSATMDSDKKNMNYFYNLLYPIRNRCISLFGIRKYAHLMFYHYKFDDGLFIPHKGFMGYNHIMFEQNMMKSSNLVKDYIELIRYIADKHFYNRKQENEKLLILFSTVDMCTVMTKAFTKFFPDLVVKRYVQDDTYADMLTGDIIISTNGSTGTAIDIPGLLTVIQTVPISDKQLNIQALGRLREIPGREVIYISLHCDSIQSHLQYVDKRYKTLKDRVAHVSHEYYFKKVGDVNQVSKKLRSSHYTKKNNGFNKFRKFNIFKKKFKPYNPYNNFEKYK